MSTSIVNGNAVQPTINGNINNDDAAHFEMALQRYMPTQQAQNSAPSNGGEVHSMHDMKTSNSPENSENNDAQGMFDLLTGKGPSGRESQVRDQDKTDDKSTEGMKGSKSNVDLPELKSMSGKDAVKLLKENDIIRFDGPLAGKIEETFIKNFDSSDFFRSSVEHAFKTEGKEMTFSSDKSLAVDGAAAYASSKDGRGLVYIGDEKFVRQDLVAHEFFHFALDTDDGGTKDNLGDYGKVPGLNQIAEAAFAEEAGIEHGRFDLYKNGTITQASDLNIDFDKFMELRENTAKYGEDGSKDFKYEDFVKDSGDFKSLKTEQDYDGRLNNLVSTITQGVDTDKRTTLYLENDLAEQYKDLVSYHLNKDPNLSVDDANDKAKDDLLRRLDNSSGEADVFRGYLSRHGGDDTAKKLAEEAFNEFNHEKK